MPGNPFRIVSALSKRVVSSVIGPKESSLPQKSTLRLTLDELCQQGLNKRNFTCRRVEVDVN